jgi:hypothetical protein
MSRLPKMRPQTKHIGVCVHHFREHSTSETAISRCTKILMNSNLPLEYLRSSSNKIEEVVHLSGERSFVSTV